MPRRPPHFKVFASIQNHRKMVGVYDDDALLAMYVRAGIMAIERYADRTHDSFLVSRRDLMRVAATQPWANAQKKLHRLVAATPLRVRCECAASPLGGRCECSGVWLDFPNLAKKQFSRHGNGTETESSSTSTSTSSIKNRSFRAPRSRQLALESPEPKKPPAPRNGTRNHIAEVRAIWPQCQAASAEYGKRWNTLGAGRERLMAARLKEHPDRPSSILVDAIHGAWESFGAGKNANFDALRYLRPQTVYQASKFDDYLEAYRPRAPAHREPETDEERRARAKRNQQAMRELAESTREMPDPWAP